MLFFYFLYLRLVFGLVFAGIVWMTPLFKLSDGSFPLIYYGLIIVVYLIHQVSQTNCLHSVYTLVRICTLF